MAAMPVPEAVVWPTQVRITTQDSSGRLLPHTPVHSAQFAFEFLFGSNSDSYWPRVVSLGFQSPPVLP